MAVIGASRVILSFLICVHLSEAQSIIPDVVIKALWPKGLILYMPDTPNVSLFVFQGNINTKIGNNDVGYISAEVSSPKDGKWQFEDLEKQLRVGDVIHYYVYVVKDRKGYLKDNLSYTISVLEGSPAEIPQADCKNTLTLVRGGKACGGEILFEDNFDNLREDLWQIEQYIPDEPEKITLFVDGEEWGRVEPAASGLLGRLRAGAGAGSCDTTRVNSASDNKMAPFDDHVSNQVGRSFQKCNNA